MAIALLIALRTTTLAQEEHRDAPTAADGGVPTTAPAAPHPATESAVSAEQIATWIAELDSNRYRVRERATQELLNALHGGQAAALDPLLKAANSDRPEQEDRAVWIMRKLIDAEDLDFRQQVLEHLEQVQDRPQVVAEARLALAQIRHDFAVRALEQLGGRFYDQGVDQRWGQMMPRRVVFADEWHGGDDGLKHCAELRDVPLVMVFGTNITVDGLAQLAGAESIRYLRLYGTNLSATDAAELQTRLPGVEIDFRRGAFLGVIGDEKPQAAVVRTVQPNTAAANAGLRTGDIIRKFNGRPVANFKELTQEIAKHVPGDEVTIEIDRGTGPTDVKVELGQWKAPQ